MEAFHFDCQTNTKHPPSLPYNRRNRICFIDNAQRLRDEKSIAEFGNKGMSFCLAFSPFMASDMGSSKVRCPLQCEAEYFFTPFTPNEFDLFVSKTSFRWSEQIKAEGVFLPRIIVHIAEAEFEEKEGIIRDQVSEIIAACYERIKNLGSNGREYKYAFLTHILTPYALTSNQKSRLLQSGLYYYDKTRNLRCAYPYRFIITECKSMMTHQFSILRDFDKGSAEEYLFVASVMDKEGPKIEAVCKGNNPCCLNDRAIDTRSQSFPLSATQYLHQTSIAQLPNGWNNDGVILIKLVQKHPAVDFLIIDNCGGASSKRLFFVQVSVRQYQERQSEDRCSSVKRTFKDIPLKQSPLSVYSNLTSISLNQCYFVYASSAQFHLRDSDQDKNIVYFYQLHVPT